MKLLDIPGVGSRIQDKLVERYGSEENALKVILRGDIATLADILGKKQALFIAKWVEGYKYNSNPKDFLATEKAIEIYDRIIVKMGNYAYTEYARFKIATLFPSSSRELIEKNRKLAGPSIVTAKILEGSGFDKHISRIKQMREMSQERIRDRAIAVIDLDTFEKIKSRGLDKLIDVLLIESQKELKDLASSYSHICFIGAEEYLKNVESAESLDDWYLVPEKILNFYRTNLQMLRSVVEAASILDRKGLADFNGLDDLRSLIERLAIHDEELKKYVNVLSKLRICLDNATSWANAELKEKIEASTITLGGSDLLQALNGKGVKELFEIELSGIFQAVLREARSIAASCLELTGSDTIWLEEIMPNEIHYPFELNRFAIREFEQELKVHFEILKLNANRKLAQAFADKKEFVNTVINSLLEFDFICAIGKFAVAEKLVMPVIMEESCLGFENGLNMFLENAEPVSYSLGKTGLIEFQENVAVLSGVNSGGKTSLLDLLAQVTILGHMGLPVPAKSCLMGIFSEFYYFTKSKSTLSTGAFEAAMIKFALVANNRRKLVFADELEAITEPGASAIIIACLLDELNDFGSVAIFVSHLAGEIKRFAKTAIRIDGIEAKGLDEMNNLIVSRNPRYNFLARSTPELILDRLVRTTEGEDKKFYSRILARFK